MVAVGRGRRGLLDEPSETNRVDAVRVDAQHVAGAVPGDDLTSEQSAQGRDQCLQGVGRVARRIVAPQFVDQAVVGHRPWSLQGELGQQSLQLHAGDRHGSRADGDLDRAEQADRDVTGHLQSSPDARSSPLGGGDRLRISAASARSAMFEVSPT